MTRTTSRTLAILTASVIFSGASTPTPNLFAGSSQNATLAQDNHEGLTVSADPYAQASRCKEKFGKADPYPLGILPVEVFLRNETALPLRIGVDTVKLSVHGPNGSTQDIDHLTLQEVAQTLAHPSGAATPHKPRFPLERPDATDKKTDKMREILQPLALDSDVVPPMGMLHGFLFFDVSHNMEVASNASLYIPDVTKVPSNQPLMFFEVALNKTTR
jgi:hypothetical protein